MKKTKICITGALGYIGSNLCELLSGEARYKDIIAIDNRFLSARVEQLRVWGIQFVQCSILDTDVLKIHLQDADIVYHLAGITDVAYTATQSNPVQDELIRSVGVDGTRNVLAAIPPTCKLIFPSTHVIFEGLEETELDIPEHRPSMPLLTYAQGKHQSELDIILWEDSNYDIGGQDSVVVRLGSVYGYSGDTMRIGIMPNLFSKIASQNGTINLFGGGVQYKNLIHVTDVVRAMKFLAESDHTGTYHLSNENMTVRQVAEICKEINPAVTLIKTADEIPNKGYTLSNAKLLSTGFKFLYNIQDAIRDMITRWSVHSQPTQLEYLQKGANGYVDNRGVIRNYELTEPINLIGWIESNKGSVRANHYHPIQEQKCLLLSGRYISVIKDLSYLDAPIETRVIRPGDIAVIRPNVAHAMIFLQDSIFLNLVRGEREHENYGITHTIPYQLVTDDNKEQFVSMYRSTCRCCNSDKLQAALSLGMSPLANNLLNSPNDYCEMFPLDWDYCPNCYNVQLSCIVPASKLFDNYLYVSSTSATFRQHFEQAVDHYINLFGLNSSSLVLDIGSNDGISLKPLQDRGIRVVGVEPAANIVTIANTNGITTIHGYFNADTRDKVYNQYGSPDLITASNVFAHADDLIDITNKVFEILKQGGTFIIEVQYLMDTIKDMTFDNIYHEHVNYWSVSALNYFFSNLGNKLFHVEHIDTHGGSIRCYICRDDRPINLSVEQFIDREIEQGIYTVDTFRLFGKKLEQLRATVRSNMQLLKKRFSNICGYGSPAKATTALNYFGITGTDIMYTIEDNELKCGKYLPGVDIPIGNHSYGPPQTPDLCIVLAWNFYDSIVEKHQYMIRNGMQFVSIKDLQIADHMPILDTKVTDLKGTPSTGKVYDCFLFYNELDLLELRLNILDPVVDHFVIVEANITHSGMFRDYCFVANRERFSKWQDKIIYIQIDDMPQDFTDLHYLEPSFCYNKIVDAIRSATTVQLTNKAGCREYWQRESIIRGLQDAQPDDIIMLSDVDEIPDPVTLQDILSNFDNTTVYSMRQNSYYYKLNLLKEKHWVGPRLSSYTRFQKQPVGTFRHIRDLIVADGGWHFSFQTASGVADKLTAYSHADMATPDVMVHLDNRIHDHVDPFNRGGKLKVVPLDNSYPQYLLENIDHYKHMMA